MADSAATAERTWVPLGPRERRVAGVLIEKQKTTPDIYPMSVAAIVTACNQKSNRDPITNYDADDVEEVLDMLRRKGVTVLYEGTGRVVRWKHMLYEWLNLKNRPNDMAVIAELLLRGPQTEGELRARAGRMADLPDLDALHNVLSYLVEREMVIYLTPPGQRRGAIVTHNFYPPEELAKVRQTQAARVAMAVEEDDEPAARPARAAVASATADPGELDGLRGEVATLRGRVDALEAELAALKTALGA
jgi:uncharacterized protein YceH (UPF0502 family)